MVDTSHYNGYRKYVILKNVSIPKVTASIYGSHIYAIVGFIWALKQ